jgi:hypothetical protein
VLQSFVSTPEKSNAQNKDDMSVTPEVSHVEMWPYVASAVVASDSHAVTAVRMLLSVMTLLMVGRGVGAAVVGSGVAGISKR